MKAKYIKPELEIVSINAKALMLTASTSLSDVEVEGPSALSRGHRVEFIDDEEDW